jgi:hypothetical protein
MFIAGVLVALALLYGILWSLAMAAKLSDEDREQ